MKATFNELKKDTVFNVNHRKESHFTEQYTGIIIERDGAGYVREVVTLRIYQTNARTYCCVWINGKNGYRNGSGYVGGYGYHRASAAAQCAIENAGISLSEPINGRGDDAIRKAVFAIVRAAYSYSDDYHVYVTKAHA